MKEKLCDTCRYRNNVEQLKPCIIYRDDCEYYEKERVDMTRKEKIALLIDELGDIRCNNFDADTDEDKTLKEAVRVIKALEQEPKTGHWIDREIYDADRWKCSECGRTEPYKENYCPNCGANMLEPQESEG